MTNISRTTPSITQPSNNTASPNTDARLSPSPQASPSASHPVIGGGARQSTGQISPVRASPAGLSKPDESQLPNIYATLSSPSAEKQHGTNKREVSAQLFKLRGELGSAWRNRDFPQIAGKLGLEPGIVENAWEKGNTLGKQGDFRDLVALALPTILRDAKFDPSIYEPRNDTINGYGRYLLHSDDNAKESFCLQMFAFSPKQKTPIHDHPNECASYVVHGELSERLYSSPTGGASENGRQLVEKNAKNSRELGSIDGFGPNELNIPHSLKNKSGELAVSVHLYRDMDGLTPGNEHTRSQQVAAKEMFDRVPKSKPATLPS